AGFPPLPDSDTKRVGSIGIALDVGREALPLVSEILHAVVTGRPAVVGDVEHAPALGSEVRARGVRGIGVEEHRVARPGRYRAATELAHVVVGEGLPLLAQEPARVLASAQLEAAVLGGGGIDADHGGDEQVRVGAPAGLLVLVRLEAVSAGERGFYLFLEE